MKRERRDDTTESALSLSFVDVLSCGFGAMLFVFLIFSILPHIAGGHVGAARLEDASQSSSEGSRQSGGQGLLDEGARALIHPPLLVQFSMDITSDEYDIYGEFNESGKDDEDGDCSGVGAPLYIDKIKVNSSEKYIIQEIFDCDTNVVHIQILWESFSNKILNVTIPNSALRRNDTLMDIYVLSASGGGRQMRYNVSKQANGQQVLSLPIIWRAADAADANRRDPAGGPPP